MNKKLNWIREAFSREVVIKENDQPVGGMHQNAFSRDVDAHLYDLQVRFDVTGFLLHSVNIYDVNADDRIVGQIAFYFGKRAELTLATGEVYTWKRQNMLMRDWNMIREGATDAEDRETVNYSLTRAFFVNNGDIRVDDDSPNAALVVLTGLFVRNYFQRRRRMAAAGVFVAAGT